MKYILAAVLVFLLFSSCRVRKVAHTSTTKDSVVTLSKDSVHVSSNSNTVDSVNITSYDKETTIYFDKTQSSAVDLRALQMKGADDSVIETKGDRPLLYYGDANTGTLFRGVDRIVIKEKYNSNTKTAKQENKTDSAAAHENNTTAVHDEVKTKTVEAKPSFTWIYISAFALLLIVGAGYLFMKFKKFV